MPRQFYQVNFITRINQLQEYAGHWRVAAYQDTYGVTVVVKKMMVVMKHWVLLQQLPVNTTTKNVPIIAKKIKTQVLPTA